MRNGVHEKLAGDSSRRVYTVWYASGEAKSERPKKKHIRPNSGALIITIFCFRDPRR
jgi:hypothetical protein